MGPVLMDTNLWHVLEALIWFCLKRTVTKSPALFMLRPFIRFEQPSGSLTDWPHWIFCKPDFHTFITYFHLHLLKLNLKGVDAVGGKQQLPETPHDVQVGQAGLPLHPRHERPTANVRELGPIPVAAVQNPLAKPALGLHQLGHLRSCHRGKGGNKEAECCHIWSEGCGQSSHRVSGSSGSGYLGWLGVTDGSAAAAASSSFHLRMSSLTWNIPHVVWWQARPTMNSS